MSVIEQVTDLGFRLLHAPERYEEIDESGVRAQISFTGPWADRGDFYGVVGGLDEEVTYPGGVTVTRRVPLKYPSPIFENVYAYAITARGEGRSGVDADEAITYSLMRATVHFRSFPFDFGGDSALISLSGSHSSEIVTVPGTAYEFTSGGPRLDQNAGATVPKAEFSLTFHRLPSLPIALWNGFSGRVNSQVFYLPGNVQIAPGYLLYEGVDHHTTLSIGNVFHHEAVHKFAYRRIPWNQIVKADGTGLGAPYRVGSSPPEYLYPTIDLMGIYV